MINRSINQILSCSEWSIPFAKPTYARHHPIPRHFHVELIERQECLEIWSFHCTILNHPRSPALSWCCDRIAVRIKFWNMNEIKLLVWHNLCACWMEPFKVSLTSRAKDSFWPGQTGSTSENHPSLMHDGESFATVWFPFSFLPLSTGRTLLFSAESRYDMLEENWIGWGFSM